MRRLVLLELEKVFKKGRSYIAFGAIILIILLIQIGLKVEGGFMLDLLMISLKDNFYYQGNLLNGYLVSYVVLNTLWIHVPLLIAIVTGDLVSGEAQQGTLRLLLTRPVSRGKLVSAKFFGAIIYATLMVVVVAVFSLAIGIPLFGKGDLLVMFNRLNIFAQDDVMWRFLLAYSFGIIGMWVIASLSLLFSVFSKNSLGPILLTFAVLIVFNILSTFEFGIFDSITPFLFTTYINSWMLFFDYDLQLNEIYLSLGVLIMHVVVLYAIAYLAFVRKNITS
ncbi:MAG: ABC transporter permease subunit [Bacteroidales bacterium]|nr:ABC transporter permease subunit [Bacteroidales bacterium]